MICHASTLQLREQISLKHLLVNLIKLVTGTGNRHKDKQCTKHWQNTFASFA